MHVQRAIEGHDLIGRAELAAEVAAAHAGAVDRDGRFPAEAVAALKGQRLLGAMVAPEHGGEGASLADIAEVCGLMGAACASAGMVFAMHAIKLSSLVAHGSGSAWHEGFMARIAGEQMLLASSTTEAGVGGDMRNSLCAVMREGERFTVEKQASVISYGAYADAILLTARRDAQAPTGDQVLCCLLRGDYTLEGTGGWDTLGMRGTCSEGWVLRAKADVAQIVPKPFAEIAAQSMLAASHILWGALWQGVAADAVARAQAFIKAEARKKPGSTPLGAARLAEAQLKLQALRALIREGLERYAAARAEPDALSSVGFAVAINALKVGASRAVLEIVDEAMMVCGLSAYRNDTPYSLGRHLRDAHSARLMVSNDRILSNTAQLMAMHRPGRRLFS